MQRLACLATLILAATAHAQPQSNASAHADAEARHQQGVFLRVTPGVAASAATTEYGDSEYTLSGSAGRLGISAGWVISPRLIIAGELLHHAVLGPELEVDGTTTLTDDDVTWGVSYAGAGVNYYLPSNLYLNASIGAMMMTLETSTMESETELGLGLKLGVGYEWWVAPKVGLGVGLELLAGAVDDEETTWDVGALGLAFSATYN
jgi:hypothetical protein